MSSDLFGLDAKLRHIWGAEIAGVDEAGRGPWAGPVVAGAVILREDVRIEGLNDSKLLSPQKRSRIFKEVCSQAKAWAVGIVSPNLIDRVNILQATYEAMRQAVSKLPAPPGLVVVDGHLIPGLQLSQVAFFKADGLSASVAAASVVAKVTRDRLMEEAHRQYPVYGFDRHKGYGTADHWEALKRWGPCDLHRKSFAPVRRLVSK